MATTTSTLVSDILQIISDWRGESAVNSDAARIRAISRAEQDIAMRTYWRHFLLRNQTSVGDGTNDLSIGSASYPMRPKGLTEVFNGGTTEDKRHSLVDFNAWKDAYNRDNATRTIYEWYDAANDIWKVHFGSTVSASTTVTYSYYWMPPKRTLTTERIVCPNPQAVAHLALAEIYHGEDELQKEQLERQLAEQLISEMIGMENAPAHGQTYQMGAVENAGRNRGFGSY